MTMTIRLTHLLMLTVATVYCGVGAAADDYPSRTVTMVVPFPAGGATDVIARLIAQRLSDRLKQPFVVENRVGANGAVGSLAVAQSAPDGYKLVMGGVNSHAINDSMLKRPPFNSATSFAPIGLVAEVPIAIVVHSSLGVSNLAELGALARANPGVLAYGSSGVGSPQHLAMELFKATAKLDITHVPYMGGGPQLNDLVSGNIKIGVIGLPPVLQHLAGGKLKALAVVEGKRSQLLPDVPTIAEQGYPGFGVSYWIGLLAPAKTPDAVIRTLSTALDATLDEPQVIAGFRTQGAEILKGSPKAFESLIVSEIPKWSAVVNSIGAKVDN